ncbi:signal peptidase I [Streptomyces sp. A7024]|uniref:Signal peptidase I n=1 Tax=Streptomyces coryli TaxID=1128680 RepID=A0A6G4U7H6_9ACTN|nr:signal peptidase I [Streptomyces coryli]NGN68195.1 signal peptidase I [Streptomyces coryli]
MSSSRTARARSNQIDSVVSGLAVALGCVLFLGGFAWGAITFQPYTVPTDSMAPTVGAGDRVLAERTDGAEVRRGDVVVFQDKVWGDLPMVKRVVAVGGDTVSCCDKQQRIKVNGKAIDEPYVAAAQRAGQDGFGAVKVPEGKLFLLGDHRADSLDSREHLQNAAKGSVSRAAVRGRVEGTVWPLGTAGTLAPAEGFAGLPGGVTERGPLRLIVWAVFGGAVMILGGAAYGPVARRIRGR